MNTLNPLYYPVVIPKTMETEFYIRLLDEQYDYLESQWQTQESAEDWEDEAAAGKNTPMAA